MSAAKTYRDMSEAERLGWGATEHDTRVRDLQTARGAEGMKAAQDAAVARRRLIGASQSWAATACLDASKARRREEAAKARSAQ